MAGKRVEKGGRGKKVRFFPHPVDKKESMEKMLGKTGKIRGKGRVEGVEKAGKRWKTARRQALFLGYLFSTCLSTDYSQVFPHVMRKEKRTFAAQ